MSMHHLSKILLFTYLISFAHSSHSTVAVQGLEALLAQTLAKLAPTPAELAQKSAEVKSITDAIALLKGRAPTTATVAVTPIATATPKAAAAGASTAKSKKDKKQDARLDELEAGINDDKNLTGDQLKMKVNTHPFKLLDSNEKFYAPVGAKAQVKEGAGTSVLLNFTRNTDFLKGNEKPDDEDYEYCEEVTDSKDGETVKCSTETLEPVKVGEQYVISRDRLDKFGFRRRGFVYGGLVVPFKYYLGGDKRVSSSTMVAPYIGVRGLGHVFGAHITPVFSAGLGLVPVNKSTTGDDGKVSTSTETKSALSAAAGLVFTSEKNKAFTAGILIGKDFLSKADQLSDPTVDKFWTSLYIGLNVKATK